MLRTKTFIENIEPLTGAMIISVAAKRYPTMRLSDFRTKLINDDLSLVLHQGEIYDAEELQDEQRRQERIRATNLNGGFYNED